MSLSLIGRGFFIKMFKPLFELIKKVKRLDQDKMVKKSLDDKSLQREVLRMNTEDQLYNEGVDSKGKSLGEYSKATILGTKNFEGKIQKGQRYDHITLNDTGAFYNSFKFKNEAKDFVISADTSKQGTDLTKQFGKDILGLTDENTKGIIPDVKKSLLSQLRQKLKA